MAYETTPKALVVVEAGTDNSLPRPDASVVYWKCAAGVTPQNAEAGDIIFNAST